MIWLQRYGLTPIRKVPLESHQLNLTERDSSATIVPVDMTGIGIGDWMLDDDGPGSGAVWRIKSITQNYATQTPRVQLEHIINTLRDRLLFTERGPAEITGNPSATTCTAKQAIEYVLLRQNEWTLGQFDYNNVSGAYKFNGDSLYDCIESVCNTLQDCWWTYDFSAYPFTLNIVQKSSVTGTVLRAGRNLSGVQKTIDRSGMITRFYPVGKDDLHIDSAFIDKNVDLYGIASRVETDQSITTKAALTAWANEMLDRHAEPIVTINVDAFNLAAATGETLDDLKLGQKCRVMMEEFGGEIEETITAITYNDKVKTPEVAKVTLANNRQDATKIIAEAIKQTRRTSRTSAYNNRKVCIGATVNGDTLTLTFGDGSEVNFNKAASQSGYITSLASVDGAVPSGQEKRSGTVRVAGTDITNAPYDKSFAINYESFTPSGSGDATAAVYFELGGTKIARFADGNLLARNIKKDVVIMGITGSYELTLESDPGPITPTTADQLITPSSGYNGLEEVTVKGDENLVAGNIKNGVTIFGVTGTFSTSASINRIYEASGTISGETTVRSGLTIKAEGTNVATKSQGYTLQKAIHSDQNFVELLEGTNNPIVVGRISTESVWNAGMTFQLGKMVPFIGDQSNEAYNNRITTITSNGTYYACAEGYKSHTEGYDNTTYSSDRYATGRSFTVNVPTGGSHSPVIDQVYTSQSYPSGATLLNSLKTQYENAKEDGDNFLIRVKCGSNTKTYYCTP